MSSLRTVSTRRLAAVSAGVVAIGVTGVAIAQGGDGAKPPAQPLATAIHQALTAPAVEGVTARIRFTNHLIAASNLQGANPLLTGASGRLWASGDRLRLELQSRGGDVQIVADRSAIDAYDASTNTAYHLALPRHPADRGGASEGPPSLAAIRRHLADLMQRADVSGAVPSSVAGEEAYTVHVSPSHDPGLIGDAALAWDAARGVPLRAAITARGSDTPVVELEATDISFGPVPASDFDVTPPAGAKRVTIHAPRGARRHAAAPAGSRGRRARERAEVTGLPAVSAALPFALSAPDTLGGQARHEVRLIDVRGHRGALVTYGSGFGGIVVFERASDPASATSTARRPTRRGRREGEQGAALALPVVSIDGVSGQELDTPLGTLVRFSRGGVDYTVAGSVTPDVARAAARGL